MNRDQYIKRELEKLDVSYAQVSQGWKDTYKSVFKNPALWNEYDSWIQSCIKDFTENLSSNSIGLPSDFDWNLIKAMIWVESGGPLVHGGLDWRTKPFQIGNQGDSGLAVVLAGDEKIPLIWSKEQRKDLTAEKVRTDPKMNIKAGIAYLLNKLMKRDASGKFAGWRALDPDGLARAYNGGGDTDYAHKIRYVQAIMRIAREAEFMR